MIKISYLLLIFAFISCNSNKKLLVGIWKFESITNQYGIGVKPISTADYMEIKRDGTFYYILYDAEIESSGKWDIDENNLIYTYEPKNYSRTYLISLLNSEKLELLENGIKYSFKK